MRTTADGTRSIANPAEQARIYACIFRETIRIKEVVAVLLWALRFEGRDLIGLARQFEVKAVHQFVVGFRGNADRKACLECRNPRECAPIKDFAVGAVT